jgi:hypothetical protein
MLVEFRPEFNIQEKDKIYYNIVPWSSKVTNPIHTPPAQNTSHLEYVEPEDPNLIEETRAANYCTWKGCPYILPFSSDAALENHLEAHAEDVTQRWSGETVCTWSGCVSKAKFKLLSALDLHLKNVHVKPLLCVQPGYPFKRPFRNIRDLQRHVLTKHSQTAVFRCPYKDCKSSTRSFARKDKWLQHVQEAQHQLDNFCPVQHCEKEVRGNFEGFQTVKEVVKHMFDEHARPSLGVRDFSCAIGGCENGDPPYLTKAQLWRHLEADHSLFEGTQEVIDAVEATEPHQVQTQLVPKEINFVFCRVCRLPPTPNHGFNTFTPLSPAVIEQSPATYDTKGPQNLGGRLVQRRNADEFIDCVSYPFHRT